MTPQRSSRSPQPDRPARSPRGRAGPHPHGRSTTHRTEDRTPTPSTIWTGKAPSAEDDVLAPDWLVEKTVTALSSPGARVALLDEAPTPTSAREPEAVPDSGIDAGARIWELAHLVEHLGRHTEALTLQHHDHPAGRVAVPYWDTLADPATDANPSPTGTGPGAVGDHRETAGGEWQADLVIALAGPHGASDGLGMRAASKLRAGGTLAVLTHSDHQGGQLLDPIGSVVATAQNADLLYLQHIIAVHAGITDGALDPGQPTVPPGCAAHRLVHSDILLFAQPTEAAL